MAEKFKIDWEDWKDTCETGISFCGLMLLLLLMSIIGGMQWLYDHTPKRKRELEAQKREIEELEKKLRTSYDPYYDDYGGEYIDFLRKMDKKGFTLPDIIIATMEEHGGLCAPEWGTEEEGFIMIHKDCYDIPPHSCRADKFFADFYDSYVGCIDSEGRLRTLSPCGNYEDYYVIGKEEKNTFQVQTFKTLKETKNFVNKFRQKYRNVV